MRPALAALVLVSACSSARGEVPEESRRPAEAAGSDPAVGTPASAAREAARDAVLRAEALGEPQARCASWPLWARYAAHFVAADGRVVDHTSDGRTTSEGQAYGLFFALVARDRARFDQLLAWTEQNLARGDLSARLPAWHWGKRDDGGWGVKDANAASDADVWIAYALFQASRQWREPRYAKTARALARLIARHEVAEVAGLGAVLLPGPRGFVDADGRVRLNPSYLALSPLRGLAREDAKGPWRAVITSSVRVLVGSAPHGLAPDWVAHGPRAGFHDDRTSGSIGSYDAIRVYLWAAALPDADPDARVVRAAASGLSRLVARTGRVPERIDVRSESASAEDGPPGFVAVALADAHARGDAALTRELRERLFAQLADGLYGTPPAYFDQNLALFAEGLRDGRYRFEADGLLTLTKEDEACAAH